MNQNPTPELVCDFEKGGTVPSQTPGTALWRGDARQAQILNITLSHINDFAYIFDLNGRFLYANQPLVDLWGLSQEAAVGKNFFDLRYPEDLAARLQREIQAVIENGKPVTGETPYTSETGRGGYYEYIFNPVFGPDGKVTLVAGSTRAITERKRAEQDAHFLSQLSQKAVVVLDPTEINRLATRELGQFLGVQRCYFCEWKSDLNQIEIHCDWHSSDARSLAGTHNMEDFGPQEWIRRLRDTGLAIGDVEAEQLAARHRASFQALQIRSYATSRFLRPDSAAVILAVTTAQPRAWREDEQTLLENVAARIWPLIERSRANQALLESRSKLEEHARTLEQRVSERTADLQSTKDELEQVCYTIAHDLRAPLRAQEGFAMLLKDDFAQALGDQGQNYAERIVQAARRLDCLVQDLLNFSRIGRSSWHIENRSLRAAFEEARENLADIIRGSQAALSVDSLHGTVRAHPATLTLILQNLLANALKFTAPGQAPQIRVWTEDRHQCLRFNIKDEGIGIAPEQHERIFGVFQRLHDDVTYPGTGIGLSLVRKGVARMGGRVGLDSAPGQGSQFWIELPKAVDSPC